MKTHHFLPFLLFAFCIPFSANAQSFLGPHSSNYDPLKMVYFNPAGMVNTEMRWQVNVLSTDVRASNDFISINKLGGIFKGEFDQNKFFKENFNGEAKNIQAEVDVRGPGFMFAFGKNAIAFSTRARVISAINDIDENFASSLFNYQDDIVQYLPSFTDFRTTAALNGYYEFSLGYARTIMDKGPHKISVGVNAKLLNKVFFAGFTGDGIDFQKIYTDSDSSINVGNTQFEIAVSNDLQDKEFNYRFGIDGFAMDAGVEYTLSPSKLSNGYRLKIGAAINDFGTLKQEYGNSSRRFVGNGRDIPIANLVSTDENLKNFDTVLDSLGTRTVPEGTMKIKLPTVLHLYADVKIVSKFFVYGGVQVNPYNFKKVDRLANLPTRLNIIPRFEIKSIGVFAPMTWDKYEGFSNGFGFRVAQFSLGSSNLISSLAKKNFTAVNFFLSLSFGGKRRTDKV